MARYTGEVRWFNNAKGLGSLGSKDGPEVSVYYTSIQLDGYKSLKEGDLVEFDVVQGERGPQADKVVRISSANNSQQDPVRSFIRRHNADGTSDSICPRCFLTASTHKREEALLQDEGVHICGVSALYPRLIDDVEPGRTGRSG